MIEPIITNTLMQSFVDSHAWAHQVAWMVTPWTKRVEVTQGEFIDKVVPVAKNATEPNICTLNAYGQHILGPDASLRSLTLISAEGDMVPTPATNIAKRLALNIEQDIRIEVWLNKHQGTTHLAKADLMNAFYRKVYKNVHADWFQGDVSDPAYWIHINKLKVTIVREISDPFSEYAFSSDHALLNQRHSAFGFVFKLSGLIFPACIPEYPELDHTVCLDSHSGPR